MFRAAQRARVGASGAALDHAERSAWGLQPFPVAVQIRNFISIGCLFALVASLWSCGRPTLELGAFAPYVRKFEEESARFGKPVKVEDLVIRFGALDAGLTGLCRRRFAATPAIILEEQSWLDSTELTRESLMFHELGHCVLNEEHRREMIPSILPDVLIPASLMNPTVVAGEIYLQNRDYYLGELFSRGA